MKKEFLLFKITFVKRVNNNMEGIQIRKINDDDVFQLQTIGKQTFFETFLVSNTKENMMNYLEKGFSIAKLEEELKSDKSEFYFAESQEGVIGYLKINTGESQTELKDQKGLEIERIYVLTNYQGKKVGQLLFEKAIVLAKEKNVDYIWLGVWEYNLKAIQFYKKNGFVEFNKHVFVLGNDEQTDIMMKLNINQNEI